MAQHLFTLGKFWKIAILLLISIPLLLFGFAFFYVYQNQTEIVQTELEIINQKYQGEMSIGSTQLAPFKNFPYLSISVRDVEVKEEKTANAATILQLDELYIGLDLLDLVKGKIDIKKLLIEDGVFNMVLHEDGSNNLARAFAMESDTSASEPLHVHLKAIELKNISIKKIDESKILEVQSTIFWAKGGFESSETKTAAHIDTEFELNIIENSDTTYIKHKQFEFHTDIELNEGTGLLTIAPSALIMESAEFELSGKVDTKNNMDLNLEIKGNKPNFDLFMAFAPTELIPVLRRYENAGKIYFNAKVEGPSALGYNPYFEVNFGASEAFLENTTYGRRVDNMGFEGYFTNGAEHDLTTMEFAMENMTAKLGQGDFKGAVSFKNFESPEIDMSLEAQFDLDFIAEFLNLSDYKNASGTVDLSMRFHDIIDIDEPEKALEDLNQAYYSELTIKNLQVESDGLPAPLKKLDAHLIMEGKRAALDLFELQIGESDLSMSGYVNDLPAIVHQTANKVKAHLDIKSERLNIAELSGYKKNDTLGVNEQIEDLVLGLSFESTAKDLGTYEYLPKGEFFIDSLHARLQQYPHELHDFQVDLLIDENDLSIKNFIGYIDDSDFKLNGKAHNYAFWMQDTLDGDVELDLGLESKRLRLEDIFSYRGENYVPEDYRHEAFDDLKLHFTSKMHYTPSGLQTIHVNLDQLDARMLMHPMRLKNASGRFQYEEDQLHVEGLHAELGRSIFNVDMNYYLGEDSLQNEIKNQLRLTTNYIDFDQLTNFNPNPPQNEVEKSTSGTEDVAAHAEAYNLYELPFSDMDFDVEIGHFIYHRLDIQDIKAKLRTTRNHYLYVESMSMYAAGGNISMNGYFNGSNPKRIYLKPNLQLKNVDLDRLLFKFENFGQDAIVSENLHGQLTASITGNIRVYPDFVPDLDQSKIHMDVIAINGRLENYDYMLMLSDYFGDKNLNNVRFDTLQNHIDVVNGVVTIPNMTIESTLGHMEISGKQDMDDNIEYYVRIPWSIVMKAASNRLFGSKKEEKELAEEDEIIEVDPNDKVRYLNLKITGTLDDFKILPGRDKKNKK